MRKDLENIFEDWSFFCYVFTYCWLLPWKTKLKLTPCTKLADTKWRKSKTALKTDLQSWTYFQLELLELMYLSSSYNSNVTALEERPCSWLVKVFIVDVGARIFEQPASSELRWPIDTSNTAAKDLGINHKHLQLRWLSARQSCSFLSFFKRNLFFWCCLWTSRVKSIFSERGDEVAIGTQWLILNDSQKTYVVFSWGGGGVIFPFKYEVALSRTTRKPIYVNVLQPCLQA